MRQLVAIETTAQTWAAYQIPMRVRKVPSNLRITAAKNSKCYSVNQIEIIQNLGNYAFAAQSEADDFIQKIIELIKKPEAAKIS